MPKRKQFTCFVVQYFLQQEKHFLKKTTRKKNTRLLRRFPVDAFKNCILKQSTMILWRHLNVLCNSFIYSDPLTRARNKKCNDCSITRSVAELHLRDQVKKCGSHNTRYELAEEKCVQRIPISAMCNRVSQKKRARIMVIGNHGWFEEKWMHYVILITHQSDIKICTTNFFFRPACLPLSSESHHSNSNSSFARCVCATRRSLITFPFIFFIFFQFTFFKTSKALLTLVCVVHGSAYNNVSIAYIDMTVPE